MTLTYQYDGKLYLNITNRCPCACKFCIRNGGDGVGDAESLWLEHEPSADEVIDALKARDLSEYAEIVFCGYGEPTENLDALIKAAEYLKSEATAVLIRLNTNGLADLSHGKAVAPMLKGLIDIVSISLNAPDAERYLEITGPVFGIPAYAAMLKFATDCKKYIPDVRFSVVDMLSPNELRRCSEIAAEMEIPLRVREKI